jgi:hypothetical protein
MKKIITCKRVCFYDVLNEQVVALMGETYNPSMDDKTILRLTYNPALMDIVDLPFHEEVWMKNSNIRVEVMHEYAEVEQWFDKLKRVIFS